MVAALSPFARLMPSGIDQAAPPSPTSGVAGTVPDFGASLADALGMAADKALTTMRAGETVSIAALQGADIAPREVVDAVMNAEQALQTTIAIRDKIVSAYLEMSRMAI